MRHPVSIARHRASLAILVFLVSGFGYYTLSTRDDAIRLRAIEFFEKATPGGVEIEVGKATFRMFEGITLHDVNVSVPFDARLDPNATSTEDRTIFSASSLRLIHDPWQLLFARLRVKEIIAVRPTIVLSHNLETGLRNWQLLQDDERRRRTPRPKNRPIVTLRSVSARVVSIREDGRHEVRTEELDADVRPHPQADTGFCIEVRRYTEPIERTAVLFDPTEQMVANTPFVDAKTVRLQLPRTAQELFDIFSVKGEVRLSRLLYSADATKETDTEIELRRVQCDVPAPPPADERDWDFKPRIMRMTDVEGHVSLHRNDVTMDISGKMNDAPCHAKGTLFSIKPELRRCGMQLAFHGSRVPMPEGVARDRMKHESVPRGIKRFIADYDPHGEIEMDLLFQRDVIPDSRLRVTGALSLLGIRGCARWFPVPVHDVFGLVHFERDHVFIDGLNGRRGDDGRVRINGVVDRTTPLYRIELDIEVDELPLDTVLRHALPDRWHETWDRFKPVGKADIQAHLLRPGGPSRANRSPWQNTIDVDLQGVEAWLLPEPGPVTDLYGQLAFGRDQVRIKQLAGRYREATVHIDGFASLGRDERVLEVAVSAEGVKLDRLLTKALSGGGMSTLSQFHPEGYADVRGVVRRNAEGELDWDLNAQVSDTVVRYDHFPYRIEGLHGEFRIRRGAVSIVHAIGRHESATIKASGEVRANDSHVVANLDFEASDLVLTQRFHDAMPEGAKRVWDMLRPSGRVNVKTSLHIDNNDQQKVSRHRTEIDLLDVGMSLRALPVPVTKLTGRILVTDEKVEIQSLSGQAAGGLIQLSGTIDLGPSVRGTLHLKTSQLAFSEKLIEAFPDSMASFLGALKPTGSFALNLNRLAFDTEAETWELDGKLELKEMALASSPRVSDCSGTLTGRAWINANGLTVEGLASKVKTTIGGMVVDSLQARVTSADGRTRIDDVDAKLYGGEATGYVEFDREPGRPKYQASITARDIQLSQYLDVHRKRKAGQRQAVGSVSGNFVVRGASGPGRVREGAGEAFVSEAQVWKLPLLFAIFQVLNLTPDENVFHDGRVKFYLTGDKLILQKIDLQGKAMSFIGGGTMNTRTDQLDVTLLAGSPVRIRVPLLTDILEGASRELMEVRVMGTLKSPKIKPQPLKSLKKALETLFPEVPRSLNDRPVSSPRR